MKAFIFDPLWDELVTEELSSKLKASNLELIVTKEVAPLTDNKALFEGNEARILCLNPDYISWKLSANDYENIPNLKAILVASTGFDYVDNSIANEKNIPVCNIEGFSTEAVAEWAITMTFNLARQIPRLIKDGFPLDYDKDFMKYRGIELHGKKVGIIGLGRIGSAIANRCVGLGMEVNYWSRAKKDSDSRYVYMELGELFAGCDIIFPTLATNDETKQLITDNLLRSMKSSAILVNIAHTGLFNQDLAIEMVKNSELFGYGFDAGPENFDSYEGNVWAAPAYGWATDSTMNNSMSMWVDNMISAASSQFPTRVNN